jgi:hypothetical protein
VQVDAAEQHHAGRAGRQVLARDVEGDEHRGARRVDGEVLAAEVEAVGHAPGDDGGEDAGQAVLGHVGQEGVELLGDLGDAVAGEHEAQHVPGGQVDGAARAGGPHRGGGVAVEGPAAVGPVAGVLEGGAGGLEGHELRGVDGGQAGGRDAPLEGVEADVGDEAAPLGDRLVLLARRRLVGALELGVEVDVGVPP